MTAHVAHLLVGHQRIIDLQNNVTLLQTHLRSRHALVRLVYYHTLELLVVSHQRTDTRILSCQHLLQLLLSLLRIILRVGVERPQHGVDARAHYLVGIQRVHIHQVQVLIQRIENLEVLGHLQIMIFHVLSLH